MEFVSDMVDHGEFERFLRLSKPDQERSWEHFICKAHGNVREQAYARFLEASKGKNWEWNMWDWALRPLFTHFIEHGTNDDLIAVVLNLRAFPKRNDRAGLAIKAANKLLERNPDVLELFLVHQACPELQDRTHTPLYDAICIEGHNAMLDNTSVLSDLLEPYPHAHSWIADLEELFEHLTSHEESDPDDDYIEMEIDE